MLAIADGKAGFCVCSTPDLLSFKSLDIAEQMTLLDAQLFQKIEVRRIACFDFCFVWGGREGAGGEGVEMQGFS